MNIQRYPLWIRADASIGDSEIIRGRAAEEFRGPESGDQRQSILRWLASLESDYAGIIWDTGEIRLGQHSPQRLFQVASESRSVLAYANYSDGGREIRLYDMVNGSVSETTDTGPLWVVHTATAASILEEIPVDITSVETVKYAMQLGLMRQGIPLHLPELLTHRLSEKSRDIFSYLHPDVENLQKEAEAVFRDHLKRIGAHLRERTSLYHDSASYPIEASVVIPVRNRERTIGDAVRSALEQETDFSFNVLVVNNHSSDNTGSVALNSGKRDSRLRIITPRRTDLGIGGCWNLAAFSPLAGRFLVQLDSDDLYAGQDALLKLVHATRSGPFAMTVGSYRTVDFEGSPVLPGDIRHTEWTEEEGHNNLLRVAGIGAPRVFATGIVRRFPFPNVSYGEDYAMALTISRFYRIARNHEILYLARRWEGNTDHDVETARAIERDRYKDHLRAIEIRARQVVNAGQQ